MSNLKAGDKLYCPIHPSVDGVRARECSVIYIHPEKRFCRVECEIRGQRIRESFCPFGQED